MFSGVVVFLDSLDALDVKSRYSSYLVVLATKAQAERSLKQRFGTFGTALLYAFLNISYRSEVAQSATDVGFLCRVCRVYSRGKGAYMSGDDIQSNQSDSFSLEDFDEQASGRIRHIMYNGEPWYSVIDVVGLLTDAPKPRQYWFDMKRNVQTEGFREVSEKIRQLKMEAPDGKQRLTDAANEETLLRIVQSIPSPKAEPFKQWLARVGHERLQEMENPELAADRMRKQYRALGYTDDWIDRRLQGIVVRDDLTNEWRERGAKEGKQFAALTDILHSGTFDLTTAEHKATKHIGQRANLRDSMTTLELALTILAEETSKELHQVHDSQGYGKLQQDTEEAGEVGGAARRDIEARTGRPVVSSENYKTLRQGRQRELQDPLFPEDDGGGNDK